MLRGSVKRLFAVFIIACFLSEGASAGLDFVRTPAQCLAPATQLPELSKKESHRRRQLEQTLDLLRLVQAHFEILGDSVQGKEFTVTHDYFDAAEHPDLVSHGETALFPSLSFLYTFQNDGLEMTAERALQCLEKGNVPETLSISFLAGSGIDLQRWLRLFEPARKRGILKTLMLCRYQRGASPHAEPKPFVLGNLQGKETFVLHGAAAEEWGKWAFSTAPQQLPEDIKSILSLTRKSGPAVQWDSEGKITTLNLLELERPEQPYQVCVVGMEINFEALVETLGEKKLARQSLFYVVSQLQKALSQKRNYPVPHGTNPVECCWVGKEEVKISALLSHFAEPLFSEPLVVSRLMRLLSLPSPRILSSQLRWGKSKGEALLPLYNEELRDNVLAALSQHNPGWFAQILDFLVCPVDDGLGGSLDLFEETVEFLFASGWIDLSTRERLTAEHKAGGKKFAETAHQKLRHGLPYLRDHFPAAERYARLKQNAFLKVPLRQNDVARYARQLKADEFASLNVSAESLPRLAFDWMAQRVAWALFDDEAASNDRPFTLMSRIFSLVFHRREMYKISFPVPEKGKDQLRWIAWTLKTLFAAPEEAAQFWAAAVDQIQKKFDRLRGQAYIDLAAFEFAKNMGEAAKLFQEEMASSFEPPAEEHPLNHHPDYRAYAAHAQELTAVDAAL